MPKGAQPVCFGLYNDKTSYCVYDCSWNKRCKQHKEYEEGAKARSRGRPLMDFEEYMNGRRLGGHEPVKRVKGGSKLVYEPGYLDRLEEGRRRDAKKRNRRRKKKRRTVIYVKPKPKPKPVLKYGAMDPMMAVTFGMWKYRESLGLMGKTEMKAEFHRIKENEEGQIRDLRMAAWQERYEQIVRG